MKTNLIIILMLFFALPLFSQERKEVLMSEKQISDTQYLIIARGYPKPELADPVRAVASAHDAALLNAQILAGERFVQGFDVIVNGTAEKYINGDGWTDVEFIITYPDISQYLKKKESVFTMSVDGSFTVIHKK